MPDLRSRVRDVLAARGHALDDDIVEELASHALAACEVVRADAPTRWKRNAVSMPSSRNGVLRR